MIKFLRISNIALAAQVELELGPGLTLLTGETGAGKSILVDAVGLLLGARASVELVRSGEDHGRAEAIVEAPAALAMLELRGLPVDGPEIVLRREVSASGKGRATVNGALVPLSVLRDLAPLLATIHGQHEPQGLLDPATHLALVDAFAGVEREALADAYRAFCAAESALERAQLDRRERERRIETLRHQLQEIDSAGLRPREDEELRAERLRVQNAGRLAALCGEAYALLYEDEGSALARLGQAYKRVEELATLEPRATAYLEPRGEIRASLEDLAMFLRDYAEGLEADPGRLDELEARLGAIARLQRKYGASVEEVLSFAAACREELGRLESPEAHERRLRDDLESAAGAFVTRAREASSRRRDAACEIERRVEVELGQLAMERTRFRVGFRPEAQPAADTLARASWSERGLEEAEFLLSPNPGEELRPLARIASGGELSRILLALTVAADLRPEARTLVFDEVDAGLGGRVAEVLGRKLRALAERHQVLCVTHLPQIAAFATAHYAVRKRVGRGRTLTEVVRLGESERVEEIARMLGGEVVSDSARRHAQEMLHASRGTRAVADARRPA